MEGTQVALVFATETQRTAAVHVSTLTAKEESEDLATLRCPADVNRCKS
jgi:hypothetical protein